MKKKLKIDGVVSLDTRQGMGYQGNILIRLRSDMKWFRKLTSEHGLGELPSGVVMGRKTWDSLPSKNRPLPKRINYVLTHRPEKVSKHLDPNFDGKVFFFSQWEEILIHAYKHTGKFFVIGGAEIFNLVIDLPEFRFLYVTEIKQEFPADTFFPVFKKKFPFRLSLQEGKEDGIAFEIARYSKIFI